MKKMIYSLFIPGEPKAQPRPRRGQHGNFYNPSTADSWKEIIQLHFLPVKKDMILEPVTVKTWFYFHKEQVGNSPHTAKPDIDNLVKPVMDALTKIEVWKDDSQVYQKFAQKYWTSGQSGMKIVIERDLKYNPKRESEDVFA